MARISRVIDDLTGEELSEDPEPTTITVDGQDYKLDLGSVSKERLLRWLAGEDSLVKASPRATAPARSSSTKGKTETYGHEYADVKSWAIKNGVKAANGNPVTEKTPRIGQSVYDAYHEVHKTG